MVAGTYLENLSLFLLTSLLHLAHILDEEVFHRTYVVPVSISKLITSTCVLPKLLADYSEEFLFYFDLQLGLELTYLWPLFFFEHGEDDLQSERQG